ncbi:MAG: galactose-1-phosphate uridylyltransferase [Dehalococcoidia bacterium]
MPLRKARVTKPDGRHLWYYAWDRPLPEVAQPSRAHKLESEGLELRRHPVLDEWVIVAPERQGRTFLPPARYCPLCPTRNAKSPTEVPSRDYEIAVFENRFPSLRSDPPAPSKTRRPFETSRALGTCEVTLYTSAHDTTLAQLPVEHITRLVEVWTDRYRDLAARREIAYVLIFENRGKEIGVTLTHPHGQIYGFSYLPPEPARELAVARRYRREHGRCLHCDIVAAELRDKQRIVAQNETFVAFVPHYARFPYEVHVASKAHRPSLLELTAAEREGLARVMKIITQKYDGLWDFPLPYIMVMHQRPTDGGRHPGCHFHIEFTPPHRTPDKLKFLAGCETGAGTYILDAKAEDTARRLRSVAPRT